MRPPIAFQPMSGPANPADSLTGACLETLSDPGAGTAFHTAGRQALPTVQAQNAQIQNSSVLARP